MAQIIVSGTTTLAVGNHTLMHNVLTIDSNSPLSALYVAGTTGNIGINTLSPLNTLSVNGSVAMGTTHITLQPGVGNIASELTTLGTPAGAIVINLAPGNYIENSLTFPNVPVTINGNGATIITGLGAGNGTLTFPNGMFMDNVTLLGSIVQSSTSTSFVQILRGSTILGSLTTSGIVISTHNIIMGTGSSNSLITINAGSLLDANATVIGQPATGYYSRVLNQGTFVYSNGEIYANDNVNYIIDSSASGSILYIDFFRAYNYGTGGGISVNNNGSTILASNDISNCYIYLSGTSNGIVCGTSYTTLANYTILYASGSSNTLGYSTGSNISGRCFDLITVPEILGYNNLPLNIISQAPAQSTASIPGNNLNLSASNAVVGTLTSGTAAGGNVILSGGTSVHSGATGYVGIANTSPFLLPVMSTTQKNALFSPTIGMTVFDSTLNGISIYTGATSPTWKTVTSM